jgi:hypothetical protein
MAVATLPAAPSATDDFSTFPTIAAAFFTALSVMVSEANSFTSGTATPLSLLPAQPTGGSADFADIADGFVAGLSDLVSDVNGMITELGLSCGAISTLPATPSRSSDPANFGTEGPALVAALATLRTELNAFITSLNSFDHGQLLLSGDMQGGTTDSILLSGDMQSGTDNLSLSGSY